MSKKDKDKTGTEMALAAKELRDILDRHMKGETDDPETLELQSAFIDILFRHFVLSEEGLDLSNPERLRLALRLQRDYKVVFEARQMVQHLENHLKTRKGNIKKPTNELITSGRGDRQ